MSNTVNIPEIKDILKTGMQFGHSTSRWNPKMSKYIFDAKGGIHIIDVVQTKQLLEDAANFLEEAASRGNIMFIGTKRQAARLIKDYAIESGSFYVINRWPGGLFTNWNILKRSLKRLKDLEAMFDEGVEGRTKYEISKMKVEWSRLERLYGGIKQMENLPTAVVVVDPRYEKVAIQEARKVNVPVVALTDTNCDPKVVDYIIPGNDDALGSIDLVLKTLVAAIVAGNKGKGIKHDLTDYSAVEVKIVKTDDEKGSEEEVAVESTEDTATKSVEPAPKVSTKTSGKSKGGEKGILELAKERAEKKSQTAKK